MNRALVAVASCLVLSCYDNVQYVITVQSDAAVVDSGSGGAADAFDAPAVDLGADRADAPASCPDQSPEGRVVDLLNDPSNCGACGHACQFPNGAPLCEKGVCRGGVCDSGFRDLDGVAANGCECALTGKEACDQIDNDCDGLVDASIVDGAIVPACTCSTDGVIPESEVPATFDSGGSCAPSYCQRHGGSFALNYCCDVGMFAQCHVDSVKLNRFDADHGGKGILEVSFCVTQGVVLSMLHVWYGVYPFRKALPLVGPDAPDLALPPGCYVRYFSPQDVLCAAYDPNRPMPVSDVGKIPFPKECIGPPPNFYTWRCPGGRWVDTDPKCNFDYDNAPIWITVEDCVGPSSSVVSLRSVNYLSDDCACTASDQCGPERPVCAPAEVASPLCPASNARCAGVCAVSL